MVDLSTTNEYLAKKITPLIQRLVVPNKREDDRQVIDGVLVEQETANLIYMLRSLLDQKKINPTKIKIIEKHSVDDVSRVVELEAENSRLKLRVAELEAQVPIPEELLEPVAVEPLGTLENTNMARVTDRLKHLLFQMTDPTVGPTTEETTKRVGPAKVAGNAWYKYRLEGVPLPSDLSPEQLEAAKLMDTIYLSYVKFDVGRKAVQDVLNHQWWKKLYPHAKVTLQRPNKANGKKNSKISWNTQSS